MRRVPASPCRAMMPAASSSSRRRRRRRSVMPSRSRTTRPRMSIPPGMRYVSSPARHGQAVAGGSRARRRPRSLCRRAVARGDRNRPRSGPDRNRPPWRETPPALRPRHRARRSEPAGRGGESLSHQCRLPTRRRGRPGALRQRRRSPERRRQRHSRESRRARRRTALAHRTRWLPALPTLPASSL